ncbi:hypothetical protein BDP27DRAFT_1370826 [Rhodocollybia butyracea]|uniref:Uncharacterized protein n=1 Tax=Rhodocollybia butyracea TaxID=206335 RepID=A0A9P5PB46_9AGAR|nr:hypothetical protein BDP27DRAFT_1370826 [Rhodocollybia butyracea]
MLFEISEVMPRTREEVRVRAAAAGGEGMNVPRPMQQDLQDLNAGLLGGEMVSPASAPSTTTATELHLTLSAHSPNPAEHLFPTGRRTLRRWSVFLRRILEMDLQLWLEIKNMERDSTTQHNTAQTQDGHQGFRGHNFGSE